MSELLIIPYVLLLIAYFTQAVVAIFRNTGGRK